jgi:hypothetical protein
MEAQEGRDIPIACVGGLVVCMRLLRKRPSDMGVAIGVVNHMRRLAGHLSPCGMQFPINTRKLA